LSVNGEHSLNDDHPSIDAAITYVKQEFKNILSKRKDLIKKLGEALEPTISNSESICEEIKSIIQEEIAQGLISRRDIERYCPPEWKRKTKPKKNDNLSIPEGGGQVEIPQIMIDTGGHVVNESAVNSNPDSNSDVEEFAKEETKHSARKELEDTITKSTSLTNADKQLSEQGRVREVETKIGRLRLDLESKSTENSELHTQVEDLKFKLKSALDNGYSQNSEDRFFEVQLQVPFEDLRRRYMGSSRGKIDNVPITVEVDLVTKSITNIQLGEADSQESTRTGKESSNLR
jgi:hypothetical protein